MFILDFKASSCQDCCIKCIVLSEYYPTNNDSQVISKNIHCCVTKFLLSVPKPKNHFSLCVNFKTSFSTEEPSNPQILSIQHIQYTTHSTPYPSIQNTVFNSLQINPQKSTIHSRTSYCETKVHTSYYTSRHNGEDYT